MTTSRAVREAHDASVDLTAEATSETRSTPSQNQSRRATCSARWRVAVCGALVCDRREASARRLGVAESPRILVHDTDRGVNSVLQCANSFNNAARVLYNRRVDGTDCGSPSNRPHDAVRSRVTSNRRRLLRRKARFRYVTIVQRRREPTHQP